MYIDEASFSMWVSKPPKTWTSKESDIFAMDNESRLSSVTVYGAVGACLTKPVFMLASSTNYIDYIRFIDEIKVHLRDPTARPYFVCDNHRSHHKLESKAKMREVGILCH